MNSYLIIKIEGRSIDKFLLKCNNLEINIIKIIYKSYKNIIIVINSKDYDKLKKIRTSCKIKIINTAGLIKIKEKIKIYKVFLISFCLGIIFLIFLCNLIFDVEVIGDNNLLNNTLIKELSNYGIEKYKLKKDFNKIKNIKDKIKKKYNDNIEWIEIKEQGTKYIINYVERKKKKDKKEKEIYSIVSNKSGIIKDIYTYKGISLVDIDNYVSKGDVLISSDILLNEEIKNRENAKGKIYAETWYKVNIEYPYRYYEKKYTNKKRKIPYLKIGNKYYDLMKYKHFDRKKLFYYKNSFNRIEVGIEEVRKIDIIEKKYNNNQALKKAKKIAKEKILDKLNDDEYIISEKTLNFYNNGSKIIVDIFFSVYEEIGEKRIIEMGEVDDTKNTRKCS